MVGKKRIKHLLKGVLAVATMALAACDSPEERVQGHYESGLALVAEGRPEQAALEFRNALRIDGDHAPSRLEMGKLAELDQNFSVAAQNYRAAAELDAGNLEARLRLARLLIAGGVLEDAQDTVAEAAAIAPDNPELLATRAALALRLGNTAAAVADAEAALATAPDLVEAHVVLVSERVAANDTDAALARINSLLQTTTDDDDLRTLRLLRLNILARTNDVDAMKADLTELAELYPDNLSYRQSLAQILAREGDLTGAERELRKIAQSQPDDPAPALDVVRFVAQTQGLDAAEQALRDEIAAAEGSGRLVDLEIALAELFVQRDQGDAARAILQTMIDRDAGAAQRARIALARIAARDGDRAEADDLVEAVLETDAENVDALALRATLAIEDYRPDDAIADIRRALEGDPGNPRLMLIEAQAHERGGNLSLTGERLAAATRSADYDPAISRIYVDFLLSRDELAAAETILSETARRNPTNGGVLTRLAEIRLRLQDWVGADQAAEALRRIEGGDANAAQIIAASLSGQGRFRESTEILRSLSDALDDPDRTMADLVRNYLRTGERDQAIQFLEDILADNPRNPRALLLRAELHVQAGETDIALERLETLIAADPESVVGYLAKARLLLALGRDGDALAVARTGIEQAPGGADALRLIEAQLFESQKRFDEAIDIYQGLYDRNPGSLLFANNLVSLLAEHREDDPEAITFAARVAQRLRGYDVPHLQDTYGWVTFLSGDAAGALQSLQSAAEGLPDNALVRYHLGRAYAALDQTEQAREHLDASLAIDPSFPKAASARAALDALPPTQ